MKKSEPSTTQALATGMIPRYITDFWKSATGEDVVSEARTYEKKRKIKLIAGALIGIALAVLCLVYQPGSVAVSTVGNGIEIVGYLFMSALAGATAWLVMEMAGGYGTSICNTLHWVMKDLGLSWAEFAKLEQDEAASRATDVLVAKYVEVLDFEEQNVGLSPEHKEEIEKFRAAQRYPCAFGPYSKFLVRCESFTRLYDLFRSVGLADQDGPERYHELAKAKGAA